MSQGKYYVVWNGLSTGIFPSWDECKEQVVNFPGAKYKAFNTKEEAILAYRGSASDHIGILKAIAEKKTEKVNYEAFPEIFLDAIAVDASCCGNPGPVEYQGVVVGTGEKVFKVGPLPGGTNNIGEYLALVHVLALLDKQNDTQTKVYADSRTSLSWLKNRGSKTTLKPTQENQKIRELLARADHWVQTHLHIPNQVLKWNTEKWGEIPADFGRK